MHRIKLFCITKYCCAPCKIVLYHEKSLCIQLNIELCFALVGHRIEVIRSTNPARATATEKTMPENNDLIGGMRNTNRGPRAARTSVEFLDVVCQTTK